MQYALVVRSPAPDNPEGTSVFAPFASLAEAHAYADEFGGAWDSYTIVPIQKPQY